ncbi:DUF3135 domain-containing protein [Vibrio sp. JC009]|uniref:DUF3135 domain-containing protein n=1 Tax=Vibrio sp. JC009 TaxID=2912314 RepID=UPI0023AF94E3|nr:DUF3135 domain-containing protein [Vibrio sp. JC009]WED21657.1 DUF3135 domain-containing protein [Vibrio sp. JC009]
MNYAELDKPLPPFDELVELAEKHPDAFEQFRQDMCEEVITYASEEMQPRLRAQQSHINRVIKSCKNPHHTNVVLMRELSSQVGKFKDVLEGDIEDYESQSADVIPFPSKCSSG